MRYAEDLEDKKEVERLNAASWQLELLKKNPDYCSWGNFEDYMWKRGDNHGWETPVELESWDQHFELDDLNELVNFYFKVYREEKKCEHCDGSGLNPATKQLQDDYYDFAGTGREWIYKLTEIEIEALVKEGRLWDFVEWGTQFDEEKQEWFKYGEKGEKIKIDPPKMPTPEEVNSWARKSFGHDAINAWISLKARAKHLGVYGHCEKCEGYGAIFTEPAAKVGLQCWIIFPRKGASCGLWIKEIKEHEVDAVVAYLKGAAKRNEYRFSRL